LLHKGQMLRRELYVESEFLFRCYSCAYCGALLTYEIASKTPTPYSTYGGSVAKLSFGSWYQDESSKGSLLI